MPTCRTSTSRGCGRYVDLDARIREGNGALRVWADVDDGQLIGGAADLALTRVDATLGKGLRAAGAARRHRAPRRQA